MFVFLDTEFTGLQQDTDLISLALVDENNESFYAEFTDYRPELVNDWVQKNVVDNLLYKGEYPFYVEKLRQVRMKGCKEAVAEKLKHWLEHYKAVEIVADVGHYDFVLLLELFGGALSKPKNLSAAYLDLNTIIAQAYKTTIEEAFDMSREGILRQNKVEIDIGSKHNSLYDALISRKIFKLLHNF